MAGEINFGILNQNLPAEIAGSYYKGQEQQQQNALAKQQLSQAQMSTQVSGMQLEKMKRDAAALDQMQKAIVGSGGPPDLKTAFQAMINSGMPDHVNSGIAGLQKLQEHEQFRNIMGGRAAAPAAGGGGISEPYAGYNAEIGAPAGAAANEPYLGYNAAIGAPTGNALAPAPTTNALAPQPANAKTAKIAELRGKIDDFITLGTPRALAAAKVMEADLRQLMTPDVLHTLAPNSSLVGPSGVPVYTAPAAPEKPFTPTDLARLRAERAALMRSNPGDPGIAEYDDAIRKATNFAPPPVTTVKMAPLEGAERKAKGELNVKAYGAVSDAARLATRTLPSLEIQAAILDKGFKTGFGTDAQKAAASVLASLGIPEAAQFATDAQTFLASTQQAVLQRQLEQKGPQTESDAQRITQTGAQLGNTAEANRFLIDVAKGQYKRDIEQRNFFDKWWSQNKTYEGAENAWYAGDGGKSLFDRPELKKYAPKAAAAATPVATKSGATVSNWKQ